MGAHGEASTVQWKVLETMSSSGVVLGATLPMAGFEVKREVTLVEAAQHGECAELCCTMAMAVVSETVVNINKLGRIYNMVQHPSIAPPFLNAGTIVDCNGKRGFAQGPNRSSRASPEKPTFEFPSTINRSGSEANARTMTGGDDDVQSYEVEPGCTFGWICATSADHKLLLGYIWLAADYPWISLWCCSRNGSPCARGLEFGTTGLHQPFPILIQHPRLLGLPTFDHLDAGETRKRAYLAFLVRVPVDFRGVSTLTLRDKVLTLIERDVAPGIPPRQITVTANMDGSLFG